MLIRGHVYRADLGFGAKPWLIVSNNARNKVTADVLAVRVTTTPRDLPTWARPSNTDPVNGYVNTDNIEAIGRDELGDYLGSLTGSTMLAVNAALSVCLWVCRRPRRSVSPHSVAPVAHRPVLQAAT